MSILNAVQDIIPQGLVNMPKLRFLVLEDHAFQRVVAINTLRLMGHTQVWGAADGHEALELLHREGAVDVAICDLHMAGMDGLTFLRQAKAAGLVKAVIISSALPQDLLETVERIVTLQSLEMLGNVGKPLDSEVLNPLLKQYVKLRQEKVVAHTEPIREFTEHEVRQGIGNQELRAYFQPKFHLRTGEVEGAEVLVRWQHPEHGLLSPASFLLLVERCGLLDEMFFSLLGQGLSLQRYIQSHGKGFKLAFNLDVSQLANPDIVDRIRDTLRVHNASACGLVFELTETGLLQAPAVCMESMVRLRMMGCGLSLDDFGVGYSSLERLCQMPFNEVKLDAGFIRDFQQSRFNAVINGVLAVSRELNMQVVAEGIETADQLHCLADLGCHLGQGFFYARPMSWAHMVTWTLEGPASIWRRI